MGEEKKGAEKKEKFLPEPEQVEGVEVEPAEAAPTPEQIQAAPDVYRRMELEDERLVMEELQGRALDVMLYSYEDSGGRRQTGFSVVGASESANTLNRRGLTRIRVSPDYPPQFEEVKVGGEDAIRCTVYVEDAKHGSGVWATAEQPLKITKRGGGKINDPFVYRKALSKAQRNGFERLIPVELVEYLKAQYLGAGQVKVIPGADRPDYDRPPPLDDAEAKKKIKRLEAIYDEIKEIGRREGMIVMPPGQFNALVIQSHHDHGALDRTIEHLEGFRDTEKEIAAVSEQFRGLVARDIYEREAGKLIGMNQQARLAKLRALAEQAERGGS